MLAKVFYSGSGAPIVFGYALYFAALFLSTPVWALQLIDALKPTFGSLATAELVSKSPFPAQVAIACSVISSGFYAPWFSYWLLGNEKSRTAYRLGIIKTQSRKKILAAGLGCMAMAFLWAWFIARQDSEIGWQERSLLSSNLIAASIHILFTPMLCAMLPLAVCNIWIALTWNRTRNAIFHSSKSDHRG
ncbi:hypothetical protein [Methyloversatilis discipulorum]|uniref:hypothetical protein n=1 Tax=Methyloversatilis discipulorum TaxID=1119528 RepID=UPI003137F3B7